MANLEALGSWLQCECPTFWSLLNEKAQRRLPPGIVKYLEEGSAGERETGRHHLKIAEKLLWHLVNFCSITVVGDAYRRDLSGVATTNQLAEVLCEIALCVSLSKLSPALTLRPASGKGTSCDVSFQVAGFPVYGEAKRYEDNWLSGHTPQGPISRSIVKAPPDVNPQGSARPRSMDLYSKLQKVPGQFPDGTLNFLFLFHPSLAESKSYIQQALFGEGAFFMPQNDLCLSEDGLFATEEWRIVSGCCFSRIEPEGNLVCPVVWENPRAFVPIPVPVRMALDRLKP